MKNLIALIIVVLLVGCQPKTSAPVAEVTGAPIDAPAATPQPVQTGPGGVKIAPTDPAERAKLAKEAPKPQAKDGYTGVTFTELSDFPYDIDENGKLLPDSKLPEQISNLDQQQVAVSGFLVPIEFVEDKVSSLILVRNQLLCCYGEEPKLNEWIFINVNPPVDLVTDVPVTLFGKFYASPDEEAGQVISLYRMEATGMEAMSF